jgi:hypothetical protein
LLLAISTLALAQNFMTVTASSIYNAGGGLLPAGSMIWQAVDSNGNPVGYQVGGGGQQITFPTVCSVVNGAISGGCQLPNVSLTNPMNVCFAVTIENSSGQIVSPPQNGSNCVQPQTANSWCSSGTCNYDQYAPTNPSVITAQLSTPQQFSLGGLYAQSCPSGLVAIGIAAGTGALLCGVGTGGIAGVTTASGSGLQGGGSTGTLSLSLVGCSASGQGLVWNGSQWVCQTPGGGAWGTISGTLSSQTDLWNYLQTLAPLISPALTGTPTAPTPGSSDNSAKVATTAWVQEQNYGVGTGNVTGPGSSTANDVAIFGSSTGKAISDSSIQISALALLSSPAFTGNPTAPTQSTGDTSTKLATTAYVKNLSYCPVAGCTFTGSVSGITADEVGLGNLTNNLQAYASLYPNTSPAAAQLPLGNNSSAYTPQTLSGDCTISVSGSITCTKTNGQAFGTAAFGTLGVAPNNVVQLNSSGQLPSVSAALLTNFPTLNQNTTGNAATAVAIQSTGGNGTFWGVSGGVQGYYTPAGAGNVSNVGSPTNGQLAQWTGPTSIQGINTTGSGNAVLATSPTFSGTVVGLTAAEVGLGNVTNAAQTIASIVPNTTPSAGQDLVGNSGGTAYAAVSMSGDCTRSASGGITCTKSGGTAFGAGAFISSTAGGDLSGTLPNPTVAQIQGAAIPVSAVVLGTNSSKQLIAQTGTISNSTTGNAGTATQLAATPTLCASGFAPLGILPNGNATGCGPITASFPLQGPNGTSASPSYTFTNDPASGLYDTVEGDEQAVTQIVVSTSSAIATILSPVNNLSWATGETFEFTGITGGASALNGVPFVVTGTSPSRPTSTVTFNCSCSAFTGTYTYTSSFPYGQVFGTALAGHQMQIGRWQSTTANPAQTGSFQGAQRDAWKNRSGPIGVTGADIPGVRGGAQVSASSPPTALLQVASAGASSGATSIPLELSSGSWNAVVGDPLLIALFNADKPSGIGADQDFQLYFVATNTTVTGSSTSVPITTTLTSNLAGSEVVSPYYIRSQIGDASGIEVPGPITIGAGGNLPTFVAVETCSTVSLPSLSSSQSGIGIDTIANGCSVKTNTLGAGWVSLPSGTTTQTIASGTVAATNGSTAISSGTCQTTVTQAASGVLSTDNIQLDFNSSPLGITGFIPATSGILTIIKWPTANNVNVAVCNYTASSITPGAVTLNFRVVR